MRTIRISHLVQGPWTLMAILCLCLLFLYVLVGGGQQHIQPGSGELDKLRVEAAKLRVERSAQNEMIKKLQDQNRALEIKIDKMQGDLQGCRNASVKHGELVQGFKHSLEINEGQNSNLRKEVSAQNEMIKKLQDQNRAVQSKIDKMQGDLQGCRNASVKHGELVQGFKRSLEINEGQNTNLRKERSAQNQMINKLQDQNRELEFKIDEMQGDLHGCRTESGRHGELVEGLKSNLGKCGRENSDLRYSLRSCRPRECQWQNDNKWWLNLPFGLGCFLRCCLGYCFK
ncbi:RILP-like protein 1 isoform X2 [Leucoraja erinacea]|uniref:RILP-like protein 1 isoform X2 n=1 Tax=Leucoraja erinaceus TaxID=7782 RepID=UPI002455EBE2|nr:RILP-like protein 1 isoform X2 [Leucoraja erinacea]